MAYFEEFAEICYLRDSKKRAKTLLDEAQAYYEDCCTALAEKREKVDRIFEEEWSDEDMTISVAWSVTQHKLLSAQEVPSLMFSSLTW